MGVRCNGGDIPEKTSFDSVECMTKILNFGSLNIDYVYKMDHIIIPGETQASLSRELFPGGKGLNQSVACAKAGGKVFHAGAVGNGDNEILLTTLKKAGVDLTYLKHHDDVPSGHTVIQVDKNGQNSIILFGGANRSLNRREIDETFEYFSKGDVLILQNEVNELEYLLKRGSELGFKIAFNVSPFSEDLLDLPLEKCAWLLVNEVEAAGIAHMEPNASATELLQGINSKLPDCDIVLTLGTRGSVYKQADGKLWAFGCYKVKAADTTGSGDTYTGFLLQALASGKSVAEAMKLAACAAAISVTRMGAASSIPDLNEVLSSELYQGADPQAPLP